LVTANEQRRRLIIGIITESLLGLTLILGFAPEQPTPEPIDFTERVRVDDIISGEVTEETAEVVNNGVEEKRKDAKEGNKDDRLSDKRNADHKHSGGAGDSSIGSDDNNRRKPVAKPAPKPPAPEPLTTQGTPLGTFEATMYTATCEGCSGVTRYGLDVRSTIYSPKGLRVIAVDPSVIEPMTVVEVTFASGQSFKVVAADIGSAINGREIDILVGSRAKALDFGRQDVEVTIVE